MKFENFNEASESGEPFYQLFYYDRRYDYSSNQICEYYSTEEELNERIAHFEEMNDIYFRMMLDAFRGYGVTELNYKDDNLWNRLIREKVTDTLPSINKHLFRYRKDKVGYCHIEKYYRDLAQEELDEQMEELDEQMDEGAERDTSGPYGGAFRDEEDFYRWKEGPGFFKD